MQKTLEVMIKLHPDVENIVAIVDDLPSGQGDLKTFFDHAEQFSPVLLSALSLSDYTFEELTNRLQHLDRKDVVLLLSAYQDKAGKTLLFHDSLKLIKKDLTRPLYHLWYHGMGQGVIGGKLISHHQQGETAAKIVLEIFAGRDVDGVHVKNESPNHYIFDYLEMQRFGIKRSLLPPDSQILNEPQSDYQQHKKIIWTVFAVFLGYTLLLAMMWVLIRRRKSAEQALFASEKHYRAIVEDQTELICRHLPDFTITFVNEAYCRYFNRSREELIGQKFLTLVPENQWRGVKDYFSTLNWTNPVETHEHIVTTPDGGIYWNRWTNRAIFDDNGEIVEFQGVGRDITEHRKAEQALKESEQKFRSLVEASPIAMAISKGNDDVIYLNKKFTELFGYSVAEVPDIATWWLLAYPDEKYRCEMKHKWDVVVQKAITAKGEIVPQEASIVCKDGNMRRIVTRLSSDGEWNYTTFHDITERWHAEVIIKGRLDLLTRPDSDSSALCFEDLFDLDEIQKVQDAFATATGVASIITDIDGRPITKPSNFTRLCRDIIRKTEKGRINCMQSNSLVGQYPDSAPPVRHCLSSGLWDSWAKITMAGQHIANWLVGQVRNETQDVELLLAYGREIGADEVEYRAALAEVPAMSAEQFQKVSESLSIMAGQLSKLAYQNLQQARAIHERNEAQRALQQVLVDAEQSRDKIDLILKSVADGLIFTDMENRLILMSGSAEVMFGKTLCDVFRQSVESAIANESLTTQLNLIHSGAAKEASTELFLPIESTGEICTLQAKSSLVASADGAAAGVITLLRDVSRERELDRLKIEFISTAAHELRTPLTAVRGFAELLLNLEVEKEQQAEWLDIIYEKSLVLERIIDDLLDLGRVESGQVIRIEKNWINITPLIKRVVEGVKQVRNGHQFEVDISKKIIECWLDGEKFVQVMENLLSNAAKFSPVGSTIRVVCHVSESKLEVTVSDQGIGMTAEQVAQVFDKFYRVDSSNTAQTGLGLGMAIVKSIIEAHDGKIWVESELGKGTSISFSLPRCAGETNSKS
ncbi:MAG: PocR ligand-binding domain-containing protein [Deltaproteobacteria bacterium]|nr:PocR ligand-binding domain-containing protein [Deltaproteobacteria bacterium]